MHRPPAVGNEDFPALELTIDEAIAGACEFSAD
jgi:hypothetical protein